MPEPRIRHINLDQLGDYIANDFDSGRGVVRVRHLTRGMYADVHGDEEFDKLSESMKEHGIINPLFVDKDRSNKYLVDGHHRAIVARELGINRIPITSDWRNTE